MNYEPEESEYIELKSEETKMVKITEVKLNKDEYKNVDFKKQMQPMTTAKVKLSESNRPFRKDVPAGKSKSSGKDYAAFTTYKLKCEYEGEEIYLSWAGSDNLAREFETYSVGDTVEIFCQTHPKGKSYSLSLVE